MTNANARAGIALDMTEGLEQFLNDAPNVKLAWNNLVTTSMELVRDAAQSGEWIFTWLESNMGQIKKVAKKYGKSGDEFINWVQINLDANDKSAKLKAGDAKIKKKAQGNFFTRLFVKNVGENVKK